MPQCEAALCIKVSSFRAAKVPDAGKLAIVSEATNNGIGSIWLNALMLTCFPAIELLLKKTVPGITAFIVSCKERDSEVFDVFISNARSCPIFCSNVSESYCVCTHCCCSTSLGASNGCTIGDCACI